MMFPQLCFFGGLIRQQALGKGIFCRQEYAEADCCLKVNLVFKDSFVDSGESLRQ